MFLRKKNVLRFLSVRASVMVVLFLWLGTWRTEGKCFLMLVMLTNAC